MSKTSENPKRGHRKNLLTHLLLAVLTLGSSWGDGFVVPEPGGIRISDASSGAPLLPDTDEYCRISSDVSAKVRRSLAESAASTVGRRSGDRARPRSLPAARCRTASPPLWEYCGALARRARAPGLS